MNTALLLLLLVALPAIVFSAPGFFSYSDFAGTSSYEVTYTNRSLLLNGQPSLFFSGSVHYPRSTPGMWPGIMRTLAQSGLNMVEIYVFWNFHEPTEGTLDWSGRGNLTAILDAASSAGLFVNLRIGPYVCAEWAYGGIPAWLAVKPGVLYRSYNDVWRAAMAKWVATVVNVTRDYFSDRGGPIILSQIENELGGGDPAYTQWSGDLANSFGVGAVWIMCNGASANNTVNTCNGNDCAGYLDGAGQNGKILITQPGIWTENEEWFNKWGDVTVGVDPYSDNLQYNRSPMDQAFVVARFFARGGSVMNYYMYHGGNNYGRTAGGGVTTMYANFANLHSHSLPNEPKHTHLSNLHKTIASLAPLIVNLPAQVHQGVVFPYYDVGSGRWLNGTQQLAFCYGAVCFVESSAPIGLYVQWQQQVLYMPAGSLLLYNGNQLLFNTSSVKPVKSALQYTQVPMSFDWSTYSDPVYTYSAPIQRAAVQEKRASANGPPVWQSTQPLEQVQLTLDTSDHMWYTATFAVTSNATQVVIKGASANAYLVWIDGKYVGAGDDHTHSWPTTSQITYNFKLPSPLQPKIMYTISILSSVLGLDNGMATDAVPYTQVFKGIVGSVTVGNDEVTGWTMRSYVSGEWLGIYTAAGRNNVVWTPLPAKSTSGPPLQWYTSEFLPISIPAGGQLLINAAGLTRGHIWINGNDIGSVFLVRDSNGQPTQSLYHIPPDWITQDGMTNNVITIFEEVGAADISSLSFVIVQLPSTNDLKNGFISVN